MEILYNPDTLVYDDATFSGKNYNIEELGSGVLELTLYNLQDLSIEEGRFEFGYS